MDIPTLIISICLLATVVGFFSGLLPYPFGWILLSIALVGRLLYLSEPRH